MGNQELRILTVFLLSFIVTLGYASSKINSSLSYDKKMQPPVSSKVLNAFFKFVIWGDIYPTAQFYAVMKVGDPGKDFFLDLDSGSHFTWIYSEQSAIQEAYHPPYITHDNLVPKDDPYCLSASAFNLKNSDPTDACVLTVDYADGGHVQTVLVRDYFNFSGTDTYNIMANIVFGAGKYENKIAKDFLLFDGVMGVGKNKLSIVSQLKEYGLIENVFGHCFTSEARFDGYGFFGNPPPPLPEDIAWIKMISSEINHYAVGPAILIFDEQPVAQDITLILDSGSTYTYFNPSLYLTVGLLIVDGFSGTPIVEKPEDTYLPVCWGLKDDNPINTIDDVNQYFKPIKFGFSAEEFIVLQPKDYLVISLTKHVCLGILDGGNVGLGDINLIGDVSMLDKLVIYDNERGYVGWANAESCSYSQS